MGNPASDKRKKTEKRRKKYEERLGPGVYLPKEERLKVNAEVEKMAEEAAKAAQTARNAKAAKTNAKKEKPEVKEEESKQ